MFMNGYFIAKWVYCFINVQIRVHISKLQKILNFLICKNVDLKVDNYDVYL